MTSQRLIFSKCTFWKKWQIWPNLDQCANEDLHLSHFPFLLEVMGQVPLELFKSFVFFCFAAVNQQEMWSKLLILQEREDLGDRCQDVDYMCWQGVTPAALFILCTDFGLPDTFLSAVKSAEVSVHADIHLQPSGQKLGAAHKAGTVIEGWWSLNGSCKVLSHMLVQSPQFSRTVKVAHSLLTHIAFSLPVSCTDAK